MHEEAKDTTICKYMEEAGVNDFIQAILQPMMDYPLFTEYFLLKKYEKEEDAQILQPACTMLTRVCKVFFQKDLKLINGLKVNMDFVEEHLEPEFVTGGKNGAVEFFEHIWKEIKYETGFNRLMMNHDLFKQFFTLSEQELKCANEHTERFISA